MSQSFYKYIVKDLLLGYFKATKISKGNRYYFIVENEKHREGLMEAIKENSEKIILSGIYQGNASAIQEEAYETYMLNPGDDSPKVIIGYDKTATEDYLTTIRNTVGVSGSKYEDYSILYILSDSILSSIITACQDLQAVSFPLNSNYVISNIWKKAENLITKDFERIYLYKHLGNISESIEDGICNLFDFKSALNVLSNGKLLEHYNELDFFTDMSIYDPTFQESSDDEMSLRVDHNHRLYRKISDIMNEDDKIDRLNQLQKILDEKLSKRINKLYESKKWREIDFAEILESIKNKNKAASLQVEDVSLESEGLLTKMIKPDPKGSKKKSTTHIVICDNSETDIHKVVVKFNKEIKKDPSYTDCLINGNIIKFNIHDKLVKQSVGTNENHHDFYMMKITCCESFFKDIKNCFSLNKKGDITVIVPEESDSLTFGDGEEIIELPITNTIDWKDIYKLVIDLNKYEEEEKIQFTVNFQGKDVKFILKLYAAKAIPPIGPEIFPNETVYRGGDGGLTPFAKITDGDKERAVFEYWRIFLEWEQQFIDKKASSIEIVRNELTGKAESKYNTLQLPNSVESSLNAIYKYFDENNLIPSLCPINDEIKALYKAYCKAVCDVIENIPSNRGLYPEELNITRLGTLCNDGKVYLSPFHPLIIAYLLEYNTQFDKTVESTFAKKLLSPFYLMPYIYFNSKPMRPYTDSKMCKIHDWLCYEDVDSKQQERTNDITSKMVTSKMDAFINHFKYLFPDKSSPIIISTIGITDDTNVIKGIIEFIKRQYNNGVQKIELHEYVDNLMEETFFEKLNRLDSIDSITRELESIDLVIESKDSYTNQEIIHQLFTRVSFYKHKLSEDKDCIGYSHIAFFQMDTGTNFCTPIANESRMELSMNGLISVPSTLNKGDYYIIGFGTKGLDKKKGNIYPMALAMNNLYANDMYDGSQAYKKNTCVAKNYNFEKKNLLESIYKNSNWVTFINPEVDIDFFYRQDVYIVHYTDQYTINAKYDSITVTKHIDQYENMLRQSYEKYSLSQDKFNYFNKIMIKYFNCLNGSWLLNIVNKSEFQIREKMSIVASSIAMLKFMNRIKDVIWIPISLEEILRVTGSIGLPQDYIFTKKSLGAKGMMSDDLLMMGLDCSDSNNLKLYYYPVEVKVSKNASMDKKAKMQVNQTFSQIKEHIFGESNFTKNIYRTFFASQYLNSAEKLNANSLLSDSDYEMIERFRFQLLNLEYDIIENLPVEEIGNAATISFFKETLHSIVTSNVEDTRVCSIHLSEEECFQFVADPAINNLDFLLNDTIIISNEENESNTAILSNAITPDDTPSLFDIEDDADDDSNEENESNRIDLEEHMDKKEKESENNESTLVEQSQRIKIVVGHTPKNKYEMVFEPNNTNLVSHPNMGIIGTMGTGKTQFARSVIAQLSKESVHNVGGHPIGVLIFDYKGDYKDKEFLDTVGGSCYKFNFPFNPLKLVVNEEVAGMNLPAITADRISDSFAKAYGLGLKQQSNIKQVILDTYADAGISKNPFTWNREIPTMEDVINKYFETYDANDKAYALFDKLRDYTIFTPDNSCCVSLFEWLDKVQVIDLTIYPDDTKKVIVSLILDLFYAEMRQLGGSKQENGFRELRAIIMVDEAHQFIKKDFNSFRSIISEGRMFGVGMILSTQNISDFKSSAEDYSQFILSWVIHHVNSISKSEISSIFGASDPNSETYIDFINRAKLFESICKIGASVEGIRDLPYFELVKIDDRFKKEE